MAYHSGIDGEGDALLEDGAFAGEGKDGGCKCVCVVGREGDYMGPLLSATAV
jgi:hypothetical protein